MRAAVLLMTATALGGCVSLNELKPGDDSNSSHYYTLDTASRMLCKGDSNRCQDLAPINTSSHLLAPIEQAYGRPIEGPNYSVSLMKLVLQPPENSYPVTAVNGKRYHYRIPVNDQTRTVWLTLSKVYGSIYNTPGR